MDYPSILDRSDLPAVFRSVRCPRQNHAFTVKPKTPNRDLLKRIAELAGSDVANQICDEFGGQQVYVRASVVTPGRVYCRDCRHLNLGPDRFGYGSSSRCQISALYVSPVHLRTCRKFAA